MKFIPILYLTTFLTTLFTACSTDAPSEITQPNTDLGTSFAIFSTTQCTANHVKVGTSANFQTFAHGVSGTLTVIDDCTLEITNLNYDGGGPQVYFYAGINSVYTGASAFSLSTRLDGTPFNNNTLRLILPTNKTLDDFDSVGIWCVEFSQIFGDVTF